MVRRIIPYERPSINHPCRIVPAWKDFTREPLVYFDTSQYRIDIEEAPLNQRAWVVQERLLAPRVVHFTDRQLYWLCAQLTASESLPRLGPNQALKNGLFHGLTTKTDTADPCTCSRHGTKSSKRTRNVTLLSARINWFAISGVAQKLKHL
jgi:hypothetical protein